MWLLRLLPALFAIALLLPFCSAAFVETYKLEGISTANFLLDTFIVDVALDVDNKLLKFYINSKVFNPQDISTIDTVITDVDPLANRYTTFHVEIDFMGKTFIQKDLRFCDMVAVKNTSATDESVRFSEALSPSSSSTDSTATSFPVLPLPDLNQTSVARRRDLNLLHFWNESVAIGFMASDNSTIEHIFSNATGQLVGCPLYQNDSIAMYFQADVSDHYNRLGSYGVELSVISNGNQSNIIGGARTYVTPVLQPLVVSLTLFWGVLSLLLATKCINIFITVFSPNQESSNPFLIEASTICNERLLKQLEASINRIIGYFQYALFMSALNLQYPGFFQPFMGQIRWCALLGIDLLKNRAAMPLLDSDNIYVTLNSYGLCNLALYSSRSFIYYSWPNFMVCLLAYIGLSMAMYQIFILFRLFVTYFKKRHPRFMRYFPTLATASENGEEVFRYSLSRNVWALVGHFLRQVLSTLGVPFLVLTFFMLYTANNMTEKGMFLSQNRIRVSAFNETLPYDALVSGSSSLVNIPQDYGLKTMPLGSIIAGCVSLVAWILLIVFFIFRYLFTFNGWKLGVNPNLRKLYTSINAVIMWSYFYNEYKPDKVPYAAVDLMYSVLLLIIIGLLQKLGTVQVVLLILLEFINLSFLITVKPFFLKMRWHSLCWIMPTARFLVITLCIPYIRPLNVSEASRTYVAYIQMLIHLLVAFIFVGHLFYCIALVGASFVKQIKEKRTTTSLATKGPTADDFNDGFEYLPVTLKQGSILAETGGQILSPQSTGGEEGGEVDYYRAKSEKILQRSQHLHAMHRDHSWEDQNTSEDFDFEETEERKKQNDYTTREGDQLYQKFFSGGVVDPEIRDLWLSRDWNIEKPLSSTTACSSPETTTLAKYSGVSKLLHLLGVDQKATNIKGFEVSRPKQIVVRPMQPVVDTLSLSNRLHDQHSFSS